MRPALFALTGLLFAIPALASSTDRAHPLAWFEATDNPSRFIARTPLYRIELTSRSFTMPGGLELHFTGAAKTKGSLDSGRPISIAWLALDRSQRRRVEGSAGLRFHNIRPGIELDYHYDRGLLEYDLLLDPGASLKPVRIESNGYITLLPDGSLRIRRGTEEIEKRAPLAWQQLAGRRQAVAVRYQRCGQGVCFALGPHDSRESLVIDPVISFATYYGTPSADYVSASATDKDGNLYIAGATDVTKFPFTQPSLPEFTPPDGGNYLAKFSLSGQLVFAALLPIQIQTLAIDAAGSTYALSSSLGAGAQSTLPGPSWIATPLSDSQILLKINAPGNDLIYATFTPGTVGAMLPTSAGELYLAGNFTMGSSKVYKETLLRLSSGGTEALVSSNLQTPVDVPTALAFDPSGNVIVGGTSSSSAARSSNALQRLSNSHVEFRSGDGGTTWTSVSPDLRTTSVWQDQAVPGRIWTWNSASGALLASTDFGATWTAQAQFHEARPGRLARFNPILLVTGFVTVPQHPDLLFLLTENGILRSANGGKTWSTISLPFASALAVDPNNTNNLLVQYFAELSMSRDGGQNWTPVPYFEQLGLSPSFAVVPGSSPTQVLLCEGYTGLLRFDFATGALTLVSSSSCLGIAPSPILSGTVYLETYGSSGLSFSEVDNGQTVTALGSTGLAYSVSVDIVPDPVKSNVLYVATDPIVERSSDGGKTWQPLGAVPAPASASSQSTSLLVNPLNTAQLLLFRPLSGNAFLTSFAPDLSAIVASTWLGGNGDETVTGLTSGPDSLITVSGTTTSTDIAQIYGGTHSDGATDARSGLNDLYIARLTPDLSTKSAFRLLGGSNYELGSAVEDVQGNVLVGGYTYSPDFPLAGQPMGAATQSTTAPNWFFTALDSNLNMLYSSFLNLGNSPTASFSTPGPTPDGRVWIAGDTLATNLPTTPGAPNARPLGYEDIYLMLFDWRQ